MIRGDTFTAHRAFYWIQWEDTGTVEKCFTFPRFAGEVDSEKRDN